MKKIVIIDFGGQYTHLISRRIRDLGVYSEVIPYDADKKKIKRYISYDDVGYIFSGSPKSVTTTPRWVKSIVYSGKPVLGICYGAQLIANMFPNSKVISNFTNEYGGIETTLYTNSVLFNGLEPQQTVWMSHNDSIHIKQNSQLATTAKTKNGVIAAFQHKYNPVFGLQFHPEVSHTKCGTQILDRFISLCILDRNYDPTLLINGTVSKIRDKAGLNKIIVFVSGGIDSLVTYSLCVEAVGPDNVVGIHIDTGLMRLNESRFIKDALLQLGMPGLLVLNKQKEFLNGIKNVKSPEEKRNIIGKLFIDILEETVQKLDISSGWILAQGTIYPDIIESKGGIKTHHNQVSEVKKLIAKNKIIEPIKYFYKNDVRKIAKKLGLPEYLINRQPFPGPGLGIRIIPPSEDCTFCKVLGGPHDDYNGLILPTNTVGVQGDCRTYRKPVVIWEEYPNSGELVFEGHTEYLYDLPTISSHTNQIIRDLPGINRVVFSKVPLHIENLSITPNHITIESVSRLQLIDKIVNEHLPTTVWQCPVVQLPIIDSVYGQLYVMRPVLSEDGMTAEVYFMDKYEFYELAHRVSCATSSSSLLLYDLTSKPPASIEWE